MINMFAVLVAAVASMLIGAWFYSSYGFGKRWMKLLAWNKKKIESEKKKSMGKVMIVGFLSQVLIAMMLSIVIPIFPASLWGGVIAAAMMWAGFVITTSVSDVLWENKKPGLWILHNGYRLISFAVMGLILSLWG